MTSGEAGAPLISVIVATYNSGDGLNRLIESLDQQTLPQEQFEVIFVDDGSTDDTFARLQELAETHRNYSMDRIENSGWPSRPRNVGISMASGEYVTFVDHDDTLYPDALRSATAYGIAHDSDIVIPKEMKTNDSWWCRSAVEHGNLEDVGENGGFARMLPMVPHKLYRRTLLLEHDIRFPERRRALWEDQFINVAAYRHARKVSLLADSPFYLWHASTTNTSHTFDPRNADFWDRLRDIMAFMAETFQGDEYRDERLIALALQVRVRVLDRLSRFIMTVDEGEAFETAVREARDLLETYGSDDVIAAIPARHQILAHLLGQGDIEGVREFQRFDLAHQVSVAADQLTWDGGTLSGRVTYTWESTHVAPSFERCEGGLRWLLPEGLDTKVPDRLKRIELTVRTESFGLALRDRNSAVVWFPTLRNGEIAVVTGAQGRVAVRFRFDWEIDTRTFAGGRQLDPSVWDLRAEAGWLGMTRHDKPKLIGTYPAVDGSRAMVAYSNSTGSLSLDTAQELRSVALDGVDRLPISVLTGDIDLALKRVVVSGSGTTSANLFAVRAGSEAAGAATLGGGDPAATDLALTIVAERGEAFLRGTLALPSGSYRLFALRGGQLRRSARRLFISKGVATIG